MSLDEVDLLLLVGESLERRDKFRVARQLPDIGARSDSIGRPLLLAPAVGTALDLCVLLDP